MKCEEIGIGSEIGGYRIEGLLGKGGMGAVYKAHELSLNRKVALKVLSQRLSADPEFIQRFKREAQIIASLDHPNIVRILSYGEERGHHYFAMEYIKGKNLDQLMKERHEIPLEETLQIIAQIASALIEAERFGVVHRDLKPTNIMIDEQGRVKVTDFGVAHLQETDTKLTRTGWFLGTPEFASPEQARGDPLDTRSDIYSLGVILYWMLTGKPPMTGDSPQALLIKIATEPLPPIRNFKPSLPEPISKLVDRMTAKDPKDRFQRPQELLSAIENCLRNLKQEPVKMETELFLETKKTRRITPRVLGAVLGIAAAIFLIVWLGDAMFLKKRTQVGEKERAEIVKVEEESQPIEAKSSLVTPTLQEPIQSRPERPSPPTPTERPRETRVAPPSDSEKVGSVSKSPSWREIPNVLLITTGPEGMAHLFRAHLESVILKGGLRVMSANEFPKLREKLQVGELSIAYYSIKEYIPKEKADILLLAHIQKTGSMTLQYYGRTQEMTSASFSIQVLDATNGTSIVSPSTGSVQFTALNMEENLKEAILSATGGLDEGIKRYWQAKRQASK